MKILHVTDSHGTVKGPEGRKDIYYVSFLKKLYELGYVIKKCGIDVVIHTGDLFHTARVSDKFAGQVADLINAFGVPVYVVPGNHDIEGYSIDTIDQTKLGLLSKTKTITLLDRDHPIRITAKQGDEEFTIAVSGQEYYAHIDEGNPSDFDMMQDEADLNILAIHSYVVTEHQHPSIKCTMANDITSDAQIILSGHYHRQFEYRNADFDIYNPGSMMRVDQTEYNKSHIPHYGILDISLNANNEIEYLYDFHKFMIALPSTTIFDYDAKYTQKSSSITLEDFKTSLANTMSSVSFNADNRQIILDICAVNGLKGSIVESLALKRYDDALKSTPDEFEAQAGYIESQHTKKISSVEMSNFQSHKDTKIHFNDGLNIFVGESNSGKTSIFRAILWVIDNQPLGSDFIMAGENECYVQINYSDGTYIKRGRTVKDTGYYEIKYIDENGNFNNASYRGFTNSVPVEVANVHQMPKVNITKDLETHLNVITQLEGPFLLTESPSVKASAIGRITGTHVIDKAVSDSKSTVQSNNKIVKAYLKDLKEKEDELKTLPDINIMQSFFNAYSHTINRLDTLNQSINYIEDHLKDINDVSDKVNVQQTQCDTLRVISGLLPVVAKATLMLDIATKVLNDYNNYTVCISKIIDEKDLLAKSKVITSLKPMMLYASSLYEKYSKTSISYERSNDISLLIHKGEETNILFNDYISNLKSLLAHCNLLKSYIEKVSPKMELADKIEEQKKAAVIEISTAKQTLKKLKATIAKTKKARDKSILDNNICPCCGQAITEAHTISITEFMEG